LYGSENLKRVFDVEISTVSTIKELEALERWWIEMHKLDENAGFFLSYEWMSSVMRAHPDEWVVIIAAERNRPVALLPLRRTVRQSKSQGREIRMLTAAGRLGWAQYAGFICHPDYEKEAIVALAQSVSKNSWDEFHFKHVPMDGRLRLFCENLDQKSMRAQNVPDVINGGTVNSLICPFVALEGTFDEWVDARSANRRKKFRKSLRELEDDPQLRIEYSTPETVSAHLEILFRNWYDQWAPQRGRRAAHAAVEAYRTHLAHAENLGVLDVPVLWREDTPMIAIANINDHTEAKVYVIATGRNTSIDEQGIGLKIHIDSIRRAFQSGMKTYDFCHGDEPYKFDFGAQPMQVSNLIFQRPPQSSGKPKTDRVERRALDRELVS